MCFKALREDKARLEAQVRELTRREEEARAQTRKTVTALSYPKGRGEANPSVDATEAVRKPGERLRRLRECCAACICHKWCPHCVEKNLECYLYK